MNDDNTTQVPKLRPRASCWDRAMQACEQMGAHIADLERQLADMTRQRDEAQAVDPRIADLCAAAMAEAHKAMQRFPQPNYVISKVAEEAGEVVKAAIHCAEGRETPENVIGEIRQALAMLFCLYLEGDQVHGLAALAPNRSPLPYA